MKKIGIAWGIGGPSGWGTYGVNLAAEALRQGIETDAYAISPALAVDPATQALLAPTLARRFDLAAGVRADHPVLHALADPLGEPPVLAGFKGQPDIGIPFFETETLSPADLAGSRHFARMIAGSTWNADILAAHGVAGVRRVFQGIDRRIFHPAPTSRPAPGRFLVFSGGKFEYRKGQDLVIAAFRQFRQRHPDALLVVAWHNPWPASVATMAGSPYVDGLPALNGGRLDLLPWLASCGIPADSVIDLGSQPNHLMGGFLRQCDAAVFANRAEGGTNLVAMEAMACGLPTILSANTGHFDLMADPGSVYRLDRQAAIPGRGGWGESAVDEIAASLETVYTDRTAAAERGLRATAAMAAWDWPLRIREVLAVVAEAC